MILLPQRLFESPEVRIIMRDGNVCVLQKSLSAAVVQREGYISNHAVSIVRAGEQHIRTYDDTLIKVKAGEVLFIPRGVYQVSDLLPQSGNFESLLFYFDNTLIEQFLAKAKISSVDRQKTPEYLKFGHSTTIQTFAEALLNIYGGSAAERPDELLELKILELLLLLNQLAGEQTFANFLFQLSLPRKRNIRNFMEQNYDKPLKIEDYAYLTGRSESTFRRDFKQYFDTTPQHWIKERRLEKALHIMQQQELSVTEVAYETGYENISYFIRIFKEKVGLSPKQYMLSLHRNRLKH